MISERNERRLDTDHDWVGSIASAHRLVDTARVPCSDASEELMFHREDGLGMIAFCCCSAMLEKYRCSITV